jgi:hypothetical protein
MRPQDRAMELRRHTLTAEMLPSGESAEPIATEGTVDLPPELVAEYAGDRVRAWEQRGATASGHAAGPTRHLVY